MKAFHFKHIVLLLLSALNIAATTITVPKDFENIQDAIDNSQPGDTIFVHKGIYNEILTLKDGISLIGESIYETIISGRGNKPVITSADNTLIKKCTIQNGLKGIICKNNTGVIESVIIRDNKETGIHCLVTIPDIRNCVIFKNNWTGIFCESARSIKSAIEHNVLAQNGYCGIMLAGRSEVLILNNLFLRNTEYGIWASQEAIRSRIVYNNFFGNRLAFNIFAKVDKSNIAEDPGVVTILNGYDFFDKTPMVLLGKGKDGATIGVIKDEILQNKINDPDGDGVYKKDDKCPSMSEDIDNFEDSDGCPDFDNDKDGIYDTQDRCPDIAEDFDGYKDDDGCDDFDDDNDSITDKKDVCPNDKEILNGYKDEDGCPDENPIK